MSYYRPRPRDLLTVNYYFSTWNYRFWSTNYEFGKIFHFDEKGSVWIDVLDLFQFQSLFEQHYNSTGVIEPIMINGKFYPPGENMRKIIHLISNNNCNLMFKYIAPSAVDNFSAYLAFLLFQKRKDVRPVEQVFRQLDGSEKLNLSIPHYSFRWSFIKIFS